MDKAIEMIYWVDGDARLVYVNDATIARTGVHPRRVAGMTLHDIDPGAPLAWDKRFAELKGPGPSSGEHVHLAKDGEKFEVEIKAT